VGSGYYPGQRGRDRIQRGHLVSRVQTSATLQCSHRPARFSVRLLNDGTTTVSVERIELCTPLPAIDGNGWKVIEVREFERGKPGAELLDVPALGGTAYNFEVAQSVMRGVYSTRIRVLCSPTAR